MPVTSAVTTLNLDGVGSAGAYLRAVEAGRCEQADVLVVAVGAGGAVAADETLESVLGVRLADVVAAAQLSGKAGQVTSTIARLDGAVLRVSLVGVGHRSASELRRAGGELARHVRLGESAVADMAAGLKDVQLSALAEGIMLGSYRYSEKSADAVAPAKSCQVRLLVPQAASGAEDVVERAAAIATAVALARDLANTPSVRK